jgi:hypothetical protein
MHVQEIKDNLNYEMYKQHTDHHQTAGGPPRKLWLPSTSTPQLQQAEFTMKVKNAVLTLFWQCEK